ncbi:VanW family protein [Sphaerisporangium sp. NPDC005289]|uniref:VanW family protein n=1 Tax=Sphaerisporangium sp. NPDC005289 TaxID=3155247 RepID=UPI0033B85A2B
MRNAGASIDPPPDPFAAVRPDSPVALPADRQLAKDTGEQKNPTTGHASGTRRKLPRGVSPLPPGVSPEIFVNTPPPSGAPSSPPVTLPPPAGPPEPWPMTAGVRVRRPEDEPKPEPADLHDPEPSVRRHGLRRVLLAVGALTLLFLLGYGVPATLIWGKVPPGTHVKDVRIGGMNATQALDRLHERFDGNDQQPLVLMLDGRRVGVLDPRDAGLTIDVDATIADAETGFPSPIAVWQSFTGERELPLRISLNQTKFADRLRRIAADVGRPAQEGAIVYNGTTPELRTPKEGQVLDEAATAKAIRRAFLDAPSPVPLSVDLVQPKAGIQAFDGALAVARRAVAEPITLVNGGRRAHLTPKLIAAHLTFTPDQAGVVRPVFDAHKAVAGLETKLVGMAAAPREAGFVIENQRPKLVHARTGKGVDSAKLADAVGKVITVGGARTIPVSLAITEPALSDAEAVRLGVKEQIAQSTTTYPCCAARVTNIHKAADLVDGMIVRPGQVFSLNEAIGDPATRGFVRAQSVGGDRLVIATGGGMSQFATTLYDAAFLAGMEEVARTPYPFYVTRYPMGREASVNYPDEDLRWRNVTEYGVLVKASYTGTALTVSLWSTRKYDRIAIETSQRANPGQPETRTVTDPDCIPMEGIPGYTVTVTRVFHKDGKIVKEDRPRTTVYEAAPKVICRPEQPSGPERQNDSTVQSQPSGQDPDGSAKQRRNGGKKQSEPSTPVTSDNNGNGHKNTTPNVNANPNGNGNGHKNTTPNGNANPNGNGNGNNGNGNNGNGNGNNGNGNGNGNGRSSGSGNDGKGTGAAGATGSG